MNLVNKKEPFLKIFLSGFVSQLFFFVGFVAIYMKRFDIKIIVSFFLIMIAVAFCAALSGFFMYDKKPKLQILYGVMVAPVIALLMALSFS